MIPEEDGEKDTSPPSILISSPADLVGHTFLVDPESDGTHGRAQIAEMIEGD